MTTASDSLPSDLAAAHAMILIERAARVEAQAIAATVRADLSNRDALIAYLKLQIEKLKRTLHGAGAERKARLLDQMELELEELEASATEDELAEASRLILAHLEHGRGVDAPILRAAMGLPSALGSR